MPKRYRLPLFTTRIGLPTGSKEAAPDGWFYPVNLAEEVALQEAGCEADELSDGTRNEGTLRYDEITRVRSLVSGPGGALFKTGGVSGMSRMVGAQGVTAVGGTDATVRNYLLKLQLEAPFRAVRLWMFSREYMEVSREWEFCVAPTEVGDCSTVTNAFVPQATPPTGWPNSGARRQYNAYVTTTDATVNGWRRGTWGGQNKSGLLYPGTDLGYFSNGVGMGLSATPGMICSDIIPCRSVPASNGERPYLLLRLKRKGQAGDSSSWLNVYSTGGDGSYYLYGMQRAWLDNKPFGRCFYAQEFNANDSVNNLTTMPASVLSFASNNNTNMGCPYFAIEVFYDVPVRSLLGISDSTLESGGWQNYGLYSWVPMAVNTKSTPDAPWTYVNGGASTCNSATFLPQLEQLIRKGYRPTDLLFPVMSTNDLATVGGGTQTAAVADRAIARNLGVLDICKRYGIRPIAYNLYPANRAPGGPRNVYETTESWARAAAASGALTLCDLRSGMQDNYLTAADSYYHLTAAGNDYAAGVLASVL